MTQKEKKKQKGNVLRFIFKHGKKERKWFAWALLATVLSTVAAFLSPQVISIAVDSVVAGETATPQNPIAAWMLSFLGGITALEAVFWCAGGVLVLSVLAGIFNYLSRMGMARANESLIKKMRDKLYRHIQYLPFSWHTDNPTGDIIQRCTSDLDVVRGFMAAPMMDIARTVIMVGVALALMFASNVKMTLISLAFMPLIASYTVVFFRLVGDKFLAADEAEGALTVMVQENLTGVRVVRAFGREKYETERFDERNSEFAEMWKRLGKVMSIYWGVGDFVTGLQIFTIVLMGTIFAVNGELTLGGFIVFVYYNQQLAWPIRALGRALSEMSKAGVSVGRIEEILDAEEESTQGKKLTPNLNCDIRFENVSFGYDNKHVLKDLNFCIPRGSTFGILGAAGSGKSTITYLLNRLYDAPEGLGNIWFGDVEIRDIDRHYLRQNLGLVLQEPFLFSKTIEENISIARSGSSRTEVRHSAAIAAVDDAISDFSKGYDTVVGERGVTLSGGQKQRVAIARTLMLGAPIMVFDDSMSAVDLETDARIREALKESTGEATVILISHRINTLMNADYILVLEDGHASALGTHAQLVKQPGLYQRIYEMQVSAADE